MQTKYFLFLSAFLFLSSSFSQSLTSALSPKNEALILDILNDACVDSWCEGAVTIEFQKTEYDETTNSFSVLGSTVQDSENIYATNSISFKCSNVEGSLIQTLINSKDLYDTRATEAKERLFSQIDNCVDQEVTAKLSTGS